MAVDTTHLGRSQASRLDLAASPPTAGSSHRSRVPARPDARGIVIAGSIVVLSVAFLVGLYCAVAVLEAVTDPLATRLAVGVALIAGLAVAWRDQVDEARRRRATPTAKPWWPRFPVVTLSTASATSLVSLLALVSVGQGDPDARAGLFGALDLDPVRTLAGEPYRVATVALLHVDPAHLVLNMTGLVMLGAGLRGELWLGHRGLAAIYLGAVAVASVVSLYVLGQPAAGASGGVMGLTGALLVRFAALAHDPVFSDGLRAEFRLRSDLLALSAVLTLALGMVVERSGMLLVDNAAHGAGLAVGVVAGMIVHARHAPYSGHARRDLEPSLSPMAARTGPETSQGRRRGRLDPSAAGL